MAEWDIPIPPANLRKEPVQFSKVAAGISVSGVEINPSGYVAKVGLANNKLYSEISASSIVSANKGFVAVDGISFDSYSGFPGSLNSTSNRSEIWGTMINQGEIIRILNNDQPTLVLTKEGKASIQYMKVKQTLTLSHGGQTYSLSDVGCNTKVPDNSIAPMIYTSKVGTQITGKIAHAIAVDGSGTVTKVYNNTTKADIPAKGYLFMERKDRTWSNEIFTKAQKGDKMTRHVTYEGSSVQNIYTALSAGPTLVKGGKVFTNFSSEGFTDAHYLGSSTHMAIGVKSDGTLVIARANCTVSQLANAMKDLGCQSAMNLDGGASAALYYNGTWLQGAGRNLTNMLVFSKS